LFGLLQAGFNELQLFWELVGGDDGFAIAIPQIIQHLLRGISLGHQLEVALIQLFVVKQVELIQQKLGGQPLHQQGEQHNPSRKLRIDGVE